MSERSIKRRRTGINTEKHVDEATLKQWNEEFNSDPTNILVKNAVTSVGSTLVSVDSNESRKTTHLFMNSLKKFNLKATNQGHSGRCWMFSGLNVFRHLLIKALDLDNFEFSETYLFFYDKLERANYLLNWFIKNPQYAIDSRETQYIIDTNMYLSDGGYWQSFTNLVKKYGVVPKEAMPETWQSADSEDLNDDVWTRTLACANWIRKNQHLSNDRLVAKKDETIKQIYNILVKYLGEPPKEFTWYYMMNDPDHTVQALHSSPEEFTDMCLGGFDMDEFVLLANFPTEKCEMRKNYYVKWTSNLTDGQNTSFLNLPIYELKKYVQKSIIKGMPVWFSADVSHGFNYMNSTLNNKMSNKELIFGKSQKFEKGDRVEFLVSGGNHAMAILGVNLDDKGNPVAWQVENSWGYADNEERGMDGFLSMSDEWFEQNLFQVAIHKKFLSRTLQKVLEQPAEELEPWDSTAPALKVKPMDAPKNYLEMLGRNRK